MSISIEYSNPYGVYYPGSEVSGTAVLNVTEPIKARSVCVFVDGRAHTHWTESESHTHTNADGSTRTESRTITYEATVIYANGETVVWSDSPSEKKLQPGIHRFPFRFILPLTCAPSFEGCYGYIRYLVKVEIDRVWKFNKANRRLFTVAPTFDLNTIPQAILPVQSSKCKSVGMVLFKHGKIALEAKIPKMGFVPGETIVLDAVIDNGSSRPIVKADIRLVQVSRYIAARSGWSAYYECGLSAHSHCNHRRQEVKKVVTGERCLDIAPKSKAAIRFQLVVPPTVSSFNLCPIITVEYYAEVKIHSKGSVNNTLKTDCPVLIGTVPIYTAQFATTVIPAVPTAPMSPDLPPPYPTSGNPSSSGEAPPAPGFLPPSYEESVYGNNGTTKDMENAEAFAPRYPFYQNLPLPAEQMKPSAPPV